VYWRIEDPSYMQKWTAQVDTKKLIIGAHIFYLRNWANTEVGESGHVVLLPTIGSSVWMVRIGRASVALQKRP
jgi:hypothetical protein